MCKFCIRLVRNKSLITSGQTFQCVVEGKDLG